MLPLASDCTPPTVLAIEPADLPGILAKSSRVTVPPEAPPSLSIKGTL